MKNILIKILFDDEDRKTLFQKNDQICITGWFDIVDELGNYLLGYDFADNDETWFELSASDDIFQWLLALCQITLAFCKDSSLKLSYGYISDRSDPPYKVLVFSLDEDNLIIKHGWHADSSIYFYDITYHHPKDIEVDINYQPTNFKNWTRQTIDTVDYFYNFLVNQNKTLQDSIPIQKLMTILNDIRNLA